MKPSQERIIIFDTTLRDGEQSPGATMDVHEKVIVAKQLELLGVDKIEAGFPVTSPGDFDAVQAVASEIKKTADNRSLPRQRKGYNDGMGCCQGSEESGAPYIYCHF